MNCISVRVTFVFCLLLATAFCQKRQDVVPRAESNSGPIAARAYPRIEIHHGRQLEYLGSFAADGKFKRVSKFSRAIDTLITASVPYGSDQIPEPASGNCSVPENGSRTAAYRTNSRIVEDVEPPARVAERVRARSVIAEIGDLVVHALSRPDRVLCSPYAVTTDSRQRVIVSDPFAHAIHILDTQGVNSLHILGGSNRRLQLPAGVAVDRQNNIYVADMQKGMVLVYNPEGKFLRYIGTYKGESIYERPTGVAIDAENARLYVLDTPRHSLYIHDLQGNLLARIGKRGGGTGPGEFNTPTAVVVNADEMIVIDSNGSRLQILDLQGHFRRQFSIRSTPDGRPRGTLFERSGARFSGLCVDRLGYIYVTDRNAESILVFDNEGNFIRSFGRPGRRLGEFQGLAGIWADGNDRIYVADSSRFSLQVFQFGPEQASTNLFSHGSRQRKQRTENGGGF